MKQKNGGPTLDGSATKRLIFELPFIAPYRLDISFYVGRKPLQALDWPPLTPINIVMQLHA